MSDEQNDQPVAAAPDSAPPIQDASAFIKILKHEKMANALISTIVAALVTLVLTPLSLSLSYSLTQHFSRPILSIEYAEVVLQEKPIPLPSEAFTTFISSDGFRAESMQSRSIASIYQFQQNAQGISRKEMKTLLGLLSTFQSITDDRLNLLGSYQNTLTNNPSDNQVRQIQAKILGPTAQYMTIGAQNDSSSVRATLVAQITTEMEALNESLKLADKLTDDLNNAKGDGIGSVQLKLSILNQGNTDGLIRSEGRINFSQQNESFAIRRSTPPKPSADGTTAIAVPVVVENTEDTAERSGAVGKVEKNTMVELWFALDDDVLSSEELSKAVASFSKSPISPYEIILSDQANHQIKFQSGRN